MHAINNRLTKLSVDSNNPFALSNFTNSLNEMVYKNFSLDFNSIIVACIGTDRATGDSLGPLVGYKLRSMNRKGISIIGTLDTPLHAKNLSSIVNEINQTYENPFIIAVDACLGSFSNIGTITIGEGPLKPGAGVNKDLPEIGNIHITGIVNTSGYMEILTLQCTRLALVMKMADIISSGIRFVSWNLNTR